MVVVLGWWLCQPVCGEQRGLQTHLNPKPTLSPNPPATPVGWRCWVVVSQHWVLSDLLRPCLEGDSSAGAEL